MQTMYPGIVNSPITELAAAIDATQTEFDVLDGPALPDAPNRATIGQGEFAETVIYGSKSGNTLSEVERGAEGTARSWSAGTKISRNFTNGDYEALTGNIEELFTSGSEFKGDVAAAITAKGIPTAEDDNRQTFVDNILEINTDATAVAGDLRAGKTAYGQAGTKITGTVPVQTGGNVVPTASDIVKPAGIYDNPITVKGVVVPAANVLAGTIIAGTAGTMPNRGALNQTITSQNGVVNVSAGYFSGGQIKATFANLVAGNIKENVNVGGIVGTLVEEVAFTPGNLVAAEHNAMVADYYATPVKRRSFLINKNGVYRVEFSLRSQSGTAYAQIYKNGEAYGIQRARADTSSGDYTQDLSFSEGDYCELFLWTSSSSGTVVAYSDRMRLMVSFLPTPRRILP